MLLANTVLEVLQLRQIVQLELITPTRDKSPASLAQLVGSVLLQALLALLTVLPVNIVLKA